MSEKTNSGIMDNAGLIDTLIMDCNNLPKALFGGNYVLFCQTLVYMVQKLANLREGINADMKNRDETIAALRADINKLLEERDGLPVETIDLLNDERGE